ncbi:MAG: biotin/lipoyl-binding protein [Bacteroidales bacterium]|nr:biotin/lipoyl-binding protein [Bacteroidales bacterium]
MKQYRFKINGNEYNVAVNSVSGNIADVTVNGTPYKVEMENAPAAPVQAIPAAPAAPVTAPAPQQQATAPAAPKSSAGGKAVTSPLPGVIIAIKVNVGDTVRAGQVVAILEAMKMENEIQAEFDGTVTAINAAQGDSVLEGAAIVTIG